MIMEEVKTYKKYGGLTILILVVLCLLTHWITNSIYNLKILDLEEEIEDLTANKNYLFNYTKNDPKAPNIKKLEEELAGLEKDLEKLNKNTTIDAPNLIDLNNRGAVQALIGNLVKIARNNRLVVTKIESGNKVSHRKSPQDRKTHVLNLRGNYRDLFQFLSSIEILEYDLIFMELEIKKSQDSSLEISVAFMV
tara:strand:- start:7035 stop:7616 length:582 start_codon:yes stop_codon:yes gene_type:complete